MGLLREKPEILESEIDNYLSKIPEWKILLAAAIFGFLETSK